VCGESKSMFKSSKKEKNEKKEKDGENSQY
jgi:hypothetical protein